jgi:DNA-binding NtrC family response regulator
MDKVLLVEDNVSQQRALATFLKDHGYQILFAADSESACQLLGQIPDIILLDLKLAEGDGLEVLREAKEFLPETPVIIMTGYGSVASAVEAMKQGAFDFLTKPVNPEELLLVIQRGAERSHLHREVRRMRQELLERGGGPWEMVGKSELMRRVFERIELIAPTNGTCLITGESGTGKELVARALHRLSMRKDGPFVAVNCAAIPRDLAESELFGHAKGAFTGATERHIGKFQAANRGTLLIDEVGEMEPAVQAKLVRALETHKVSPIGYNEEQTVDVRVIAATHRNLHSLTDEGKFREDLYYRLHVLQIDLPPLRQRREDIPLLIAAFLQQLNRNYDRNVQEVSLDAMGALQSNHWQGNVRELRNILEGIVVLSRKEVIQLEDLPSNMRSNRVREAAAPSRPDATLAELEREAIQERLFETGGNRQRAADVLGISTRTLLRKIRRYQLKDPLRPGMPL